MSKCRGCGAEITWAFTTNGKRIPLNEPSEPRFILRFAPDGQPQAIGMATFISHFATCPKADEFRHKDES